MNYDKLKHSILIISVLFVYFIHIGPIYIDNYISKIKIQTLKQKFNDLFDNKVLPFESLKNLKILINNYSFVKDKEIFVSLNPKEIKKALKNIDYSIEKKIILKYSPVINILVLCSITMSPMILSLKKIFKKFK